MDARSAPIPTSASPISATASSPWPSLAAWSSNSPTVDAGGLTKIHNQAVSGVSCAEVGRELGVPEMLRANEPEDMPVGIPAEILLSGERPLPEATEALIGACFLAFGFDRVAAAVALAFEPRVEHAAETRIDFKSALQELLARRRSVVSYEVIAESGPPHRRKFEVAAIVDSERVGEGRGPEQEGGRAGRCRESAETAWGLNLVIASDALARLGSRGSRDLFRRDNACI